MSGRVDVSVLRVGFFVEKYVADDIVFVGLFMLGRERGFKCDADVNVQTESEKATSASLLLPTLAVWAAVTGDGATLDGLADFVSGHYQHSNLQLWYPGSDTEENLYRGSADHGLFASSIKIERTCEGMLAPIKSECALSAAYCSLSALHHGLWPLLVSASRHHRHPVPPHLWPL